MTYTTGNYVGIEWERGFRSLKTNLFRESFKISLFLLTVGFPIVNEVSFVRNQEHA